MPRQEVPGLCLLSQRNLVDGLQRQPQRELRTTTRSVAMPGKMTAELLGQDGARVKPESVAVLLGREPELEQSFQRLRRDADS